MNKRNILWACLLFAAGATACDQPNPKNVVGRNSPSKLTAETRPTAPESTSYTDTLFIQDDFASQPFRLDSVSVPAVQHLFSTSQLIKKPVVNKFVMKQTDTLVTIRKAHSYIQLYAVNTEEKKCFYKAAMIQDSLSVFSQPLQIGQTKTQVKHVIKPLARTNRLPDIIEISNNEGTDYVYLVFRNDKLAAVKFRPYLD